VGVPTGVRPARRAYIDDIADAFVLAVTDRQPGDICNIVDEVAVLSPSV
jgi:nucleoside-diphosphate-sugar epimerase